MCLDAIGETAQTRAVLSIGPTNAVVDHLDHHDAVRAGDVDAHRRRLRVFTDVGEALLDNVVGSYLDLLGESLLKAHGQAHRRR